MKYTPLPENTIRQCQNNGQAARDAYASIADQFDNEEALIQPQTLIERQTVYRLIAVLRNEPDYHIVDEIETLIQRVEQMRPTRASILRAVCNRIINTLEKVKQDCGSIYEENHAWDDAPLTW